jgi:hypothetical protein
MSQYVKGGGITDPLGFKGLIYLFIIGDVNAIRQTVYADAINEYNILVGSIYIKKWKFFLQFSFESFTFLSIKNDLIHTRNYNLTC